MPRKTRPTGRPKTKGPVRNFRLSPTATKALERLTARWGWTLTAAVERAVIFADAHRDFTPTTSRPQEVQS